MDNLFSIEFQEILPKVYTLTFNSRYELCMSFIRLQEYYESPRFRNKVFTLKTYEKYWCKNFGKGVFTYPFVWGGFNVPVNIALEWERRFRARYKKLSSRENGLVKFILQCNSDGYIIGLHNEDKAKKGKTLNHEIAHALYYSNSEYRKQCDKLISKTGRGIINKAKKKLKEMGYTKEVFKDEIQAYFSTNDKNSMIGGRKIFASNFARFMKK